MAFISIITPNYNSEAYIEETIQSVISQTFERWEWLIVDDASTDNSVEIIEKYAAMDSRIMLYRSTQNRGPCGSRNNAIGRAKGRFIAFIDSDDLWEPEFLSKMMEHMKETRAAIGFSSYRRFLTEKKIFLEDFHVPTRVSYHDILKSNSISALTGIYDSEACGKVYMLEGTKREDYTLWLQLLKETKFAYGLDESLATYRIRSNSSSRNKLEMAREQWLIYRKFERLCIFRSFYYFCIWAFRGFKKYRGSF